MLSYYPRYLYPVAVELVEKEELGPLAQRVRDLAKDKGILDDKLRERLCPELRAYWNISADESGKELRAKVEAGMRELIAELSEGRKNVSVEVYRDALRVNYNVSRNSELSEMSWLQRRRWFAPTVSPEASIRFVNQAARHIADVIEDALGRNERAASLPTTSFIAAPAQVFDIHADDRRSRSPFTPLPLSESGRSHPVLGARRPEFIAPVAGRNWRFHLLNLLRLLALAAIGGLLAGWQLPYIDKPPFVWGDLGAAASRFIAENRFGLSVALGAVLFPPVWKMLISRREGVFGVGYTRYMVAAVVPVLLVAIVPIAYVELAFRSETQQVANEVGSMSISSSVSFDTLEGQVQRYCEPRRGTYSTAGKRPVSSGGDLDSSRCAEKDNTIRLVAGPLRSTTSWMPVIKWEKPQTGLNAFELAGERTGSKNRLYAETIVRSATDHFGYCGIVVSSGVLEDSRDDRYFMLRHSRPSDRPSELRPAVLSYNLLDGSENTLELADKPIPVGSPEYRAEGRNVEWHKIGVLRTGSLYRFFVDDREVLSHDWENAPENVRPQIAAYRSVIPEKTRQTTAVCEFDYFNVWYKK